MNEENKNHSPALPPPDLEPDSIYGTLGEKETKGPYPPSGCHLHIHSRRKRLCDADGISAKAVIDGMVKAGVLPDDSPQYVQKVSYSQEKGEPEETIVTIYVED